MYNLNGYLITWNCYFFLSDCECLSRCVPHAAQIVFLHMADLVSALAAVLWLMNKF